MRFAAILLLLGEFAAASAPERISFRRPDGALLAAEFHPAAGDAPGPAVLLLHQAGSNRREWDFLLEELRGLGVAALALDLRGHGESTPPAEDEAFYRRLFTDPDFAPPDVEAALAWLRAREGVDSARLAVVGASVGANLAFAAAGAPWGPKTTVALSGNHKNANLLAGRIDGFAPKNVFVLAADEDPGREASAKALFAQTGGKRRIEILSGSHAHGVAVLHESPALRGAVLNWLRVGLTERKAGDKRGSRPVQSR